MPDSKWYSQVPAQDSGSEPKPYSDEEGVGIAYSDSEGVPSCCLMIYLP